jgi:hypothetical protein
MKSVINFNHYFDTGVFKMTTTSVTSAASLEMGLSESFSQLVGEVATEVSAVSEALTTKINDKIQGFHSHVQDTVYARYNAVVENNARYPNSYEAKAGLKHFQNNFEFIKMTDILMEVGTDLEVYDKCLKIFQANGGIKEIATAYNGDASKDIPGFSDKAKEKIVYKMGVRNPLQANIGALQAGIEALFDPSTQPLKTSSSSMSSLSMGASSSVGSPDDASVGQSTKSSTRVRQAIPNKGSSSSSSSKNSSTSSSRTKSSNVDSDEENDKTETRFTRKAGTTTSTLKVPSSSSKSSARVSPELAPGSDEAKTLAILEAGYATALRNAGAEDSGEDDKKKSSKKASSASSSSSKLVTTPRDNSSSSSSRSATSATKKAVTVVKKEPISQPEDKTVGAGGKGNAAHVGSNTQGNKFQKPVDARTGEIDLTFGTTSVATGTDDADSSSSDSSSSDS